MELRFVVVVGRTPTTESGARGCLNMLENQCIAVVGVLANNHDEAESQED